MRCRKARTLLALHAGGDLAGSEAQELSAHLEQCAACAAELRDLERTLATVAEIARADQPDPLPADFAARVRQAARTETPPPESFSIPALLGGRHRRLAFVLASAACLLVFLVLWSPRPADDTPGTRDVASTAPADGSPEVRWQDLREDLAGCLEGPYRLDAWEVPREAGVIAIMHRPDPVNRPDTYVIDYCGEGRRLSAGCSYPWLRQRARRLIARAGSLDNLFVAVCLTPGSDRRDRREIQQELVDQYQPFFNQQGGV